MSVSLSVRGSESNKSTNERMKQRNMKCSVTSIQIVAIMALYLSVHVTYGNQNPTSQNHARDFGLRSSSTTANNVIGSTSSTSSSSSRDGVRGGSSAGSIKNPKIPSQVQITKLVLNEPKFLYLNNPSSVSTTTTTINTADVNQTSKSQSSPSFFSTFTASESPTIRNQNTQKSHSIMTTTTSSTTSPKEYTHAMIRTGITVAAACTFIDLFFIVRLFVCLFLNPVYIYHTIFSSILSLLFFFKKNISLST